MVLLLRAVPLMNLAMTDQNIAGQSTYDQISDLDLVSFWAAEAARYCLNIGLIVGSDGMIHPQSTMTRAEAVTIMDRVMNL